MKRFFRILSIILLTVSLSVDMIPEISAAWGSVIFHGKQEKFSIKPGSGYSSTDLFSSFKNAMPGDILSETVTVTNRSWDSGYIKLYLRPQPHDSRNPISYSEIYEQLDSKDQTGIAGKRDETPESMSDFLSKVTLRVYSGEHLLYQSSQDNPADAIYLGTLRRNQKMELNLELEISAALGNAYANRVGEVDWIFTAELFSDPGKPDIPKTGDRIMAAVVIMGISGLLFLLILLTGRRRK